MKNSSQEEQSKKLLDELRTASVLKYNLPPQQPRPSWDSYFMSLVDVISSRSNCLSRKVGALITIDRRIISTGYNGTPRGTLNCDQGGCPRCAAKIVNKEEYKSSVDLGECLCSHAEENTITQAAYHSISVRKGTVWTMYIPCIMCSKMIINSGIKEIVWRGGPEWDTYIEMGRRSALLFSDAGLKVRKAVGL